MPYFRNSSGDFVDHTGAVVNDPAIRLQIGQSVNGDIGKLPLFAMPAQAGQSSTSGGPTSPAMASPSVPGASTGPGATESPPVLPPIQTPVTPSLPRPTALEDQYRSLMVPSTDETATQTELDKLISARDLGLQEAKDRQVAMPFIVGEQKSRLESANLALEPLQQKLARLQAQRQASLDASKFSLDRADQAQSAAASASKPMEVGPGNSLVNPTTGQSIYTAPEQQPTSNLTPAQIIQQQQAAGIVDQSKPYYFNGAAVIRKSDNHVFANEQEAWAAGVAKDFSNVEKPQPTKAEYSTPSSPNSPNSPNTPQSVTKFTPTQINKGASVAGMAIVDFKSLSDDEKNVYINGNYTSFTKVIDTDIASKGREAIGPLRDEIDTSNLPQSVKERLKTYLESQAPKEVAQKGHTILGIHIPL